MGPRRDGERRTPLYDRPLNQHDADRHVRIGAPLMGVGMSMCGAAGLLIAYMVETSHNGMALIIAVVGLVLGGYGVTVYGGTKWGHGRKQGGTPWLQPRVHRRLLVVAEYFWLVSACGTALGGVLMAVLLVFGAIEQGLWAPFALNFFTCLVAIAMWRLARYRRQSVVSA